MKIHGSVVDEQARCVHYRTPLDIVAIQGKCCNKYYACHLCHQESEPHDSVRWEPADLRQRAVLCGVCKKALTISEYLAGDFTCHSCGSAFNPGCARHYDLYFNLAAE